MDYNRYKEGIIEAYKVLRLENSSIPSDIIDFIKNASLKELERLKPSLNNDFKKVCPECKGEGVGYRINPYKVVDCVVCNGTGKPIPKS